MVLLSEDQPPLDGGFIGFNKKLPTDVMYTDFSKAFDYVNHSLLLFKLDQLSFPSNLLTWILSVLNGRSQMVFFQKRYFQDDQRDIWSASGQSFRLFAVYSVYK